MNRTTIVFAVLAASVLVCSAAQAQQARPGAGQGLRQIPEEVNVEAAQQRIRENAEAIDADGDGFITQEEIQAHREQRRAERRAERFSALDVDGDGRISLEEFVGPQLMAVELADLNGDGIVTRAERQEARRARRGGGE